jgi:hypothetical protein
VIRFASTINMEIKMIEGESEKIYLPVMSISYTDAEIDESSGDMFSP